ncbi:MAG: hypothetical protein JXA21_05150 [Anaerolineae bacterium]|nr:hypothetical protein [Anaerolineae bacterium]
MTPEIISLVVGTIFTLLIFSYLLGDNVLYRWALAILVGSSLGYVVGVVGWYLLQNWILGALSADTLEQRIDYVVPLVLGVFLLLKGATSKFLSRFAVLGNIAMAYLIGVGIAVAVAGAILGTAIPQMWAAGATLTFENMPWGLMNGILMIVGTITALLVFSPRSYATRGNQLNLVMRWVQRLGWIFIVTALAVAFSGALTSALTTLVMRIWQIMERVLALRGG